MPSARNLKAFRWTVALAVPLVLALPPLLWIIDGTRRAAVTPLARDQGIFQYVAWALAHGARDYADVRDVNGPLTHFVHFVFLKLGGGDEHRFRLLDLVVTGVAFAFVGACIPGVARARAPRAVERAAWALAGWVTLSGQYLAFNYWDIAQRESFFDWFMLASVALQLVAHASWRAKAATRTATWTMAAVGALSVVPWFGKPTYALFTIAQLVTIAIDSKGESAGVLRARRPIDRDLPFARRRAFVAFAVGGAIGAATLLAFLFAYGDAGAYLRIAFTDVPAMYRFIWARSAADIFWAPWFANRAIFGIAGGVAMIGLIALGRLPRRTLAVALLPACAIVSIVVQAKGFTYHFHPLTAAVVLQWLVIAAWLWDRARSASRDRVLALAVATVISVRVATDMTESPYMKEVWLVDGAATPAQRATKEYFARFPEPDYFPWDLREAAAFLRVHTAPTDRVQIYGMDPYILFFAERLSATPYIYAYDLNVDAALAGGTGGHPTDAQSARIRAIRDAHERDLLERLRAAPPAAFVFMDKSPLMSEEAAWGDFARHSPDTARWVAERYTEAAMFGTNHVWLKRP